MTSSRTPASGAFQTLRRYISWNTDHKVIGIQYLVTTFTFFLIGGALAMVMRTELTQPGVDLLNGAEYNRFMTNHGSVMLFLWIIPVFSGFANFMLPIMIGAKDLAFPRINLLSWYIYVLGGIFTLVAALSGGVDTGWTFYTPYSSSSGTLRRRNVSKIAAASLPNGSPVSGSVPVASWRSSASS